MEWFEEFCGISILPLPPRWPFHPPGQTALVKNLKLKVWGKAHQLIADSSMLTSALFDSNKTSDTNSYPLL
ncbi:hypothetical protein LYNGBM3L_43740 [Moorena producens 3L]|uniref:Uncharacterized protein n=1 Tax=Moorena producens 3L TaxID=489825 RepID=F4XW58_9CYAN|nr:hypothetical protein LYNGBM3L_43740 [Moorena producens 3L]OLT65808.1 hypothetical protein BI334_12880 [Moorena producens 3L]